jgi:hypothetical protein
MTDETKVGEVDGLTDAEIDQIVRTFFAAHIGCLNVECAATIGLSVFAVGRHIAAIRKEWTANREYRVPLKSPAKDPTR